jgi:hypothetical protein
LGAAWRQDIADADRERAFRALEVATLFALRRPIAQRLDLDRALPELPRPRAAVHPG